MRKTSALGIAFLLSASGAWAQADHLLVTEVCIAPTTGEFIEVSNPTASSIDLSNYYVANATDPATSRYYYNLPTGANVGGGSNLDFTARFPAGATIAAGATIVLSVQPAEDFFATYGFWPDYELRAAASNSVPEMLEALPGTINGQGGLANTAGVAILFFWDGASDLVEDVDYVIYRSTVDGVDKSGVSIDGPDPDTVATPFLADTPLASQLYVNFLHGSGNSYTRTSVDEVQEAASGGNGITGNDETSENLDSAFADLPASPGVGPAGNPAPVISNVSNDPLYPAPGDVVTVSATIVDDGVVAAAYLARQFNGAPFDSVLMVASGSTYSATIPAGVEGDTVGYYVHAYDDEGADRVSATYGYRVSSIPPGTTPISLIQTDPSYNGQMVTVQGVITIGNGRLSTTQTKPYIQDNSGYGCQLFSFDPPDTNQLRRGDYVRATGMVEIYVSTRGDTTTEITNFTFTTLSHGEPLPTIATISCAEANNFPRWEGTWIQLTGVVESKSNAGGGWNIVINDGTADHTIRIWESTGVDVGAVDPDEEWTFRGVGSSYYLEAQTLTAHQEDVIEGRYVGGGVGTASITPGEVDPLQEDIIARIALVSDSSVTIDRARVNVPTAWGWSGAVADVSISGPGAGTGVVSVIGDRTIDVIGCAATTGDTLFITITNLDAPSVPGPYTFGTMTSYAGSVIGLEDLPQSPIITVRGSESARLLLPNRPFAPDLGETITIGYQAPLHSRVVIRLFDLEGRHVMTMFDGRYDPTPANPQETAFAWNGRDELRERVPAGVYICHLEITEDDTGRRTTDTGPVVVAVPLN